MKIILFTVAGVQPMIGNVIKEDEDFINIEHPVIIFREEQSVYTIPYMPFAKNGLVAFNKDNVISVSSVEEEIETYYNSILSELKDTKLSVKKPSSENKKIDLQKAKNLH